MTHTDPTAVPVIDPAKLTALEERRNRSRPEPRTPSSGGAGFQPLRLTLAPGATGEEERPRVIGRPGEKQCPDCGATIAKVLDQPAAWLRSWCFPPHDCEAGQRRRAAEAAAERARKEAWLRDPPEDRIAEVRRRAGLPRYSPAGFDRVRLPEVPSDLSRQLRVHREAWLAGGRPPQGLWFYGPTDSRKTVCTAALAFDVAHRTPRPVQCWNVERLAHELRRTAQGSSSRYDPEAIDAAELLVLDDLGTVKVSEAVWQLVFGILEHALGGWGGDRPRQTLYVTSNETPTQIADHYSLPGRPDSGHRIVRRLVQLCEVVSLNPPPR